MTYLVRVTISDNEYESDIEEYAAQIREGERPVFDDDGNEIDPATLTGEELRRAAIDELGDLWCDLWMYEGNGSGLDRGPAVRFPTREAAQAAIDAMPEYGDTYEIVEE